MENLLLECAKKINISLTEEMIEKFMKYYQLLIEWNGKMNLTAITEEKDVVIKHFIDSLTIAQYIPQNAKLIDVGTGAGFPGIPVKIVRADVEIVLLDSLQKRVNFLNHVIEQCNFKNISAIHGRAEEFGQNLEYREQFDIATARAVANLATLSELCTPFLKVGGTFICMKADATEEMANAQTAVKELGMKQRKIDSFILPVLDDHRTIILYQKEKHTPKKYPRKAGTPAKNPIL